MTVRILGAAGSAKETSIPVDGYALLIAELDPPNGELQSGDVNWVASDNETVELTYDENGEELPENMVRVKGLKVGTSSVEAIYTNGVYLTDSATINVTANADIPPFTAIGSIKTEIGNVAGELNGETSAELPALVTIGDTQNVDFIMPDGYTYEDLEATFTAMDGNPNVTLADLSLGNLKISSTSAGSGYVRIYYKEQPNGFKVDLYVKFEEPVQGYAPFTVSGTLLMGGGGFTVDGDVKDATSPNNRATFNTGSQYSYSITMPSGHSVSELEVNVSSFTPQSMSVSAEISGENLVISVTGVTGSYSDATGTITVAYKDAPDENPVTIYCTATWRYFRVDGVSWINENGQTIETASDSSVDNRVYMVAGNTYQGAIILNPAFGATGQADELVSVQVLPADAANAFVYEDGITITPVKETAFLVRVNAQAGKVGNNQTIYVTSISASWSIYPQNFIGSDGGSISTTSEQSPAYMDIGSTYNAIVQFDDSSKGNISELVPIFVAADFSGGNDKGASAAVSIDDIGNLQIIPITAGDGIVKITTENRRYSGSDIYVRINPASENLSAVFNHSYGLGVSGLIKGQSVVIAPKLNKNTGLPIAMFGLDVYAESGVSWTSPGGCAFNLEVNDGFSGNELRLVLKAMDADGVVVDSIDATLSVDTSPNNGVISLNPAGLRVAANASIGISAHASGFGSEYNDYVRYEVYDILDGMENGQEAYSFGNPQNLCKLQDGTGLINGAHETIVDYSPMFSGQTTGYVGIKAQACMNSGALLGIPSFFVIYVT